jgi:AraC-like DNA-binding protein
MVGKMTTRRQSGKDAPPQGGDGLTQKDARREPHLAALMLMPPVRLMVERGCDYHAALAAVGLTLQDLGQGNLRIPHSLAERFMADAVERTGDPAFALRSGAHTDLADLGLISMLLVTAPTFGDSVRRVQRFGKLLHDAANDFGERAGDVYYWYMDFGVTLSVTSAEGVVSGTVARIRFVAGPEWSPREVWFTHSAPPHAEEYRRVFRCDVRFDAPRIAIVFDAKLLDCPILGDRSMAELVERRAEAALLELAEARTFAMRVRDEIMSALGTESIGADLISRRLAVSRATLTRKLAQEGTTLSELLDGARRDLAVEYLRNGGLSVEEVARRLAFSDARAFRRAFQRWTGSSPAEFRAKL